MIPLVGIITTFSLAFTPSIRTHSPTFLRVVARSFSSLFSLLLLFSTFCLVPVFFRHSHPSLFCAHSVHLQVAVLAKPFSSSTSPLCSPFAVLPAHLVAHPLLHISCSFLPSHTHTFCFYSRFTLPRLSTLSLSSSFSRSLSLSFSLSLSNLMSLRRSGFTTPRYPSPVVPLALLPPLLLHSRPLPPPYPGQRGLTLACAL